jgi:hypothetical protein
MENVNIPAFLQFNSNNVFFTSKNAFFFPWSESIMWSLVSSMIEEIVIKSSFS